MACGLSKSLSLSSSLKKQGIGTILGADFDFDTSSNTLAASLRRAFSADMSSKNWISPNGSCPMEKISSSEELTASVIDSFGSSKEEGGGEQEERSGFDIWTQIQEEKNRSEKKNNQTHAWDSILSQKTDSSNPLPPPYVHPLVKKRSSSSLSEKSLEICTESLGSETGSDGFSPCQSSEAKKKINPNESQKVIEAKEEQIIVEQEETWTTNYNCCKKSSRGSFPPPIPSLSSQVGKSLQIMTRRNNGRLVLEVVSMPSQNNFCATRHDGRLVLTFAENGVDLKDEKDREGRQSEIEEEDEEEIEEETEDMEFEMEEEEQEPSNGLEKGHGLAHKSNGFLTVHRLAHKTIGLPNRSPGWPTNDNVKYKSEESIAHSLPLRPRATQLARAVQPTSTVDDTVGATCFNAYNYSWKPTELSINIEAPGPNAKAQYQAQKFFHKEGGGGGGVLVDAWLVGCKEQKRSSLFVEPFCIAT